jgi:hypothetical protein
MGGTQNDSQGETGKAEDAKLPDAGISPKQWPGKMRGRKKGDGLPDSVGIGVKSKTALATMTGKG